MCMCVYVACVPCIFIKRSNLKTKDRLHLQLELGKPDYIIYSFSRYKVSEIVSTRDIETVNLLFT